MWISSKKSSKKEGPIKKSSLSLSHTHKKNIKKKKTFSSKHRHADTSSHNFINTKDLFKAVPVHLFHDNCGFLLMFRTTLNFSSYLPPHTRSDRTQNTTLIFTTTKTNIHPRYHLPAVAAITAENKRQNFRPITITNFKRQFQNLAFSPPHRLRASVCDTRGTQASVCVIAQSHTHSHTYTSAKTDKNKI